MFLKILISPHVVMFSEGLLESDIWIIYGPHLWQQQDNAMHKHYYENNFPYWSIDTDVQATSHWRTGNEHFVRGLLTVHSYHLPKGKDISGWQFFFLQTTIAIPRYFSQSYGAYFRMT